MIDPPARILVVDDEVAVLFTLDLLLQRDGYQVTTATTGSEALALLLRDPFDLFVIDLVLPGMSGLEIARHARAHHPNAAIIVLTGSDAIGGVPIEGQIGPFACIRKTVSPQEVLAGVAQALEMQLHARAVGGAAP